MYILDGLWYHGILYADGTNTNYDSFIKTASFTQSLLT